MRKKEISPAPPWTSRVGVVVEKIKNAIISGELKPGEKLPTELELVEQLGIGRYSIREAIKMLVALGVLEIRRPQGTFVVDSVTVPMVEPLVYRLLLAKKDYSDLHELRLGLERTIIELAAAKATSEDLAALEVSYEKFCREIGSRSTHEQIIDLDREFHELLAHAAHSPLLEALYDTFFKVFVPALERINKARYVEFVTANHLAIIELIRDRDSSPQKIKDLVEGSLSTWVENLDASG